jgi:cysteinyl-tRNA synthetase
VPSIRVFNTLGRRLEPFVPGRDGRVGMYVCGPTVQSDPHVGHGRSAVAFDVIRRYLAWRGFEVTYVRNVTDVEDKIIAAALETGEPPAVLAARVAGRFATAYEALGVLAPDVEPKATEHIPEMLELIERLVEHGFAYPVEGGDVYFAVRRLPSYGRLSGRNLDELLAGARVEVSERKRDPLDFALWKAAKPGEPSWESPWGPGRPGWHIECSAMAARYLGATFDIHGGGTDLIFPHHENEIAQSEAASGATFARYWLHNEMLNLGGEKMSKSTGHVVDLAAAIERFGGTAVRLFYLRSHYRSPQEFSEALLEDAAAALERIERFFLRAPRAPGVEADAEVVGRFTAAMDEDFATPEALGVLFDALREANRALDHGEDADGLVAAVHEIVDVLGVRPPAPGAMVVPEPVAVGIRVLAAELGVSGGDDELVDRLVEQRTRARAERRWADSDRIRDRLAELGVVLEDAADGTRWHRR